MNLNPRTVREMQYFVGKVCTILVPRAADGLGIDNPRFIDFFVGRVDAITDDAVWIRHLVTGARSAFFEVISINEEQVIEPEHPDYDKLKEQYNEKVSSVKTATPTPAPPKSDFISLSNLSQQAKMVKEKVKEGM